MMSRLCALFVVILAHVQGHNYVQPQIVYQDGKLGERYEASTNASTEYHFVYRLQLGLLPPRTVSLRTEIDRFSRINPIRITVRQPETTLSWQLPLKRGDLSYTSMERTLCLLEGQPGQAAGQTFAGKYVQVTVVVSTLSSAGMKFELEMNEIDHFAVGTNSKHDVLQVGVTSPAVRFVRLNEATKDSLLQVRVTSKNDVCSMISIQPFQCPILDEEETVRSHGAFQTMLRLSAFNFQRRDYVGPEGVFIVFMVLEDDHLCGSSR